MLLPTIIGVRYSPSNVFELFNGHVPLPIVFWGKSFSTKFEKWAQVPLQRKVMDSDNYGIAVGHPALAESPSTLSMLVGHVMETLWNLCIYTYMNIYTDLRIHVPTHIQTYIYACAKARTRGRCQSHTLVVCSGPQDVGADFGAVWEHVAPVKTHKYIYIICFALKACLHSVVLALMLRYHGSFTSVLVHDIYDVTKSLCTPAAWVS
jgi:hypothetical protein